VCRRNHGGMLRPADHDHCGMWGGLSSSTTMRSLPLILPLRALLGDDVVTAGSIPSRARFGVGTPWRARLIGSRKPGLEVIAKVRQLDVPSTMLGFVRHLWWRHAVRDRRSSRRSAGTSSEAQGERQERPELHIELQRRDDPRAQSDWMIARPTTNDNAKAGYQASLAGRRSAALTLKCRVDAVSSRRERRLRHQFTLSRMVFALIN
jgi:hypothetical protein